MMVSFHPWRYGSFRMRLGRASHLYFGAMMRGRSALASKGLGLVGRKGSAGHEWALLALIVGAVKRAVLV